MRNSLSLVCFILLLFSLVSPLSSSTKEKPLVLTHVTVIDATGGPAQPDMTVVIRGDRIAAMGKSDSMRVPQGSQVVDATGKFLIPGLWAWMSSGTSRSTCRSSSPMA
jgi:ribulose 1,5-bisphosphate synthetase/thiazole synthase